MAPPYRCYFLNREQHIESFVPLDCEDDIAAASHAKALLCDAEKYHAVEVWRGARQVFCQARNEVESGS
jgi:hypothetical protein